MSYSASDSSDALLGALGVGDHDDVDVATNAGLERIARIAALRDELDQWLEADAQERTPLQMIRHALDELGGALAIEDECCDCADRSWYGDRHDTACPIRGPRL